MAAICSALNTSSRKFNHRQHLGLGVAKEIGVKIATEALTKSLSLGT